MPGPFGSGPFGDLPFGGTPDADVVLVGLQANAALGVLAWEDARALVGFQANTALGVFGDTVTVSLAGLQATAALGIFVEEEVLQLQGFAVTSALGQLGFTVSDNPTLLGLQADAHLGILFPVATHLLVHAVLSDRAKGGIVLGDSAVTATLGDR